MPAEEADTALAAGMLEAAEAAGEEALLEVREALPEDLAVLAESVAAEAEDTGSAGVGVRGED